MLERRRILYAGAVQGVGFRWTTLRILRSMPVTGYVRNLADGRVELVVEGTPDQTEQAVRRVREAMVHYIRAETQETGPATGEFRGFEVRR